MTYLSRLVTSGVALVVSIGSVAQVRDSTPLPTPPAIEAKLSTRGDIQGIRIYEVRSQRRADTLVVESDFQNTENQDRFIYYRHKWLDASGMQVGDGEGWKQLKIMGRQTQTTKGVAPSSKAVDFRIEFNVE